MYLSSLRRLLVLSLLLFALAVLAVAQEADILGTVTDPAGAVIPNAKVTLTNLDKGQSRDVSTNDVGQYLAPGLGIGHYRVRVEVAGFKRSEQNVVLQVNDRLRVDFKLEVGAATESVTVAAEAVAVQSESGEVSDVITGQQVTQLATNGRSMYSLATLVPGASSNMADLNTPTPVGGDAGVSFNGLRENHNLWLLDGGETSDRGGAGGMDVMPSVDSIAEFRTMTSNYSAEYGLSSGATMVIAVKSGTKDFHASAWEFVRNDALDANNFFFNRAGNKPPELRFNTYGFNVGGPVTFGRLYNKNKEKTFFFYNMEWRKLVTGGVINQTVPLTSEYGGQFPASTIIHAPTAAQIAPSVQSQLTAAGVTLGAPFPGNKIPASLISPQAQAMLQAGIFPAPNNGAQFVGGANQPTNLREEIVRIDHRFSDKFAIFGHYVSEQISQTYGTSIWSGDNVPTVGSLFGNPAYHGVVRATWSITPTILNEIAYNQNGNTINITPTGNFARPSSLSIPELFQGNNLNRNPAVQLGQIGTTYDPWSQPWHNKADDYQVRDDLSWIKGSHQLKMGASWALYKKVQDLFGNTEGFFNFNGKYTGNDFADFLLGYANTYNELAVQDKGYWNNVSPAAYFQDNWHVNSRLTLNLGLRWDGIPHTYEANNRMANFYPNLYDPSKRAVLLPDGSISPTSPGLGTSPNPILAGLQFYLNGIGIAGQNGIPKGLVKNYWNTFGPRIGFAYDLLGDHKTVVRGGFGSMFERIQGNDMYNAGPNIPFSSSVTFSNVSLSNPKTSLQTGGTLSAPITVADITGLANADYKSPVSYQYSVGVERELWANSIVSVAYVGNQNRHQNDYRETNLPDPSTFPGLINGTLQFNSVAPYAGFHSIRLAENAENSHYNSLQVSLHGRIKNDLTLQVAYTLSRAIDQTWGNGNLGGDLAGVSNPYNRAYDNGPFGGDRTHIGLVNFIYEIPLFRQSSNRMLKTVVGGWELSGIVVMESGLPLTATLGGSAGSNGIPNATNRPNLTGSVSYPGSVNQFFTANFSAPTIGAWGNEPKGVLRGPGRDNWNLSLFKQFALFEKHPGSRFELRFESFNAWNHTEFKDVSTSFSSSNFGQVTSTWDPRVFQLGAKLIF